MNDKQRAALRKRIDRVFANVQQRELVAASMPMWAKVGMLGGLEGEVRENCVCVLDNQRGYNELYETDDSFKRISIPLIRRLFNHFKTNVKTRHEGFVDKVQRVSAPPAKVTCGTALTFDITAFAFIKDQYNYQPYQMLDRECEDTLILAERLAGFIDKLNTDLTQNGETFLFLGLDWDNVFQQLLLYVDLTK